MRPQVESAVPVADGSRRTDVDVIVIGGGPAGAALGTLLADAGHRALVVERDVFPRDHVGEALTPSTNNVLQQLGVLPRLEEAGFFHKAGVGWTAPRSPLWRYLGVRTSDYPPPGAVQPYSYNVERADFDAILLRRAHEAGAKVLQGASAREVLFEDGRAIGVRLTVTDGWERDVRARFVVDASGRRCFLANRLGLRRKDREYNQFSIFSWFEGVGTPPADVRDFLFLHFLGLPRAWAWQIPLRNGVTSVGVVTDKADFQASGRAQEEFFGDLVGRNRTLARAMADARPRRPFEIEGDYSYETESITGPGWMLVGDALRFVDPIFSSGVDVALYSARFAFEAISSVLRGDDEASSMHVYSERVRSGVQIWYELTDLFYRLQLLFTWFMISRNHRAELVRVLQGNPYLPDTQATAQRLIERMREAHDAIVENPNSLLRPANARTPA
jgi:FADH2 O2-dependent halogenase